MKKFINQYFATIKQFIPDQEQKSLVGLDIGVNSCKMIELQPKGNSYQLINWAIEPIVAGDQSKAVQAILRKCIVPTNAPMTAISGKGTLIRYVDITRMALEDLKKSFAFESDKYFPFPADQIYTDCFVIDPKVEGNKMSVIIAAAKKDLIDTRIKLLTGLGLQADFIGLDPIALANVFNVLKLNTKRDSTEQTEVESKAVAVLDIGEVVSNLTILLGDIPRFTRDIFIGGLNFTKSISNALGISFEEAEKLKCNPEKKLPEILEASETDVMNLVSELRLSFDYFVNERNIPISQLFLTGGVATAEGLIGLFAKNLDVQVKKWDPLETLDFAENVSKEEVLKNSEKLGVALGLALYE